MKNIRIPLGSFYRTWEAEAANGLQLKIKEELVWQAKIPGLNDEFEIILKF